MADMGHVQTVRQGRDSVAKWREENGGAPFDLYNCYMSHVRIPMVDLHGSDMRDSDFMGAMLRRANLSGCYLNSSHLYRSDLREADLSRTLMNSANLRGADLRNANLEQVDLDQAIVSDANFTGANLRRANLSRVNLTGANLTNADLTDAVFHGANLNRTIMDGAILDGADFYEARFNNAPTVGTKFSGCLLGYTVFQNCDLSQADELTLARHDAPSTVGVDTLIRSAGKIPPEFLLGSGVPTEMVSVLGSIADEPTDLGEFYISCAEADVAFAEGLRDSLRSQGVRSWVFAENFRGNALVDRRSTSEEEEIERWVRHYDKLIVVCSQSGLDSETVRNDLSQAKDQQSSRDEWVCYVVDPDGTLDNPRARAARNLTYEHRIFDMRGHQEGADKYQEAVADLAGNLKQTQPARAGLPPVSGQL